MKLLTISKLRKEFNGETLFENVSFEINAGEKIAIIGKNGTGKSTILKMILKQLPIDDGEVHINKKSKIGYLSQDVIKSQSSTLIEEMLEVFQYQIDLEAKLKTLTESLQIDPHNQTVLNQYEKVEHDYMVNNGYEYHYKMDMILSKFGFTEDMYERKIQSFSGGEKTRVAFAKLLLQSPDLLILDEPTNHLDIEIIEWLEDYLNKYEGAVLIVTHDKYFINKVCRKIIEIDQNTMHTYFGTYEEYETQKVLRYEQLLKQFNRQQKEIAHLQSFVDRFRYNSKRASIAQDRVKKIDRMDKIDKPHQSKRKVHFSLHTKRPTSDIILESQDLTIGYNKPLMTKLNFSMRGYDKFAIIGKNGTGKTTLLRTIFRQLKPLNGYVHFLREYKIGYFEQNQATLHLNKTIFQEIHDYYPMYTNYDIRSVAAKFLFFNEDLDKPISILSGGEKVRLILLLIMLEEPDLLLLDEPTNHLDIETKDIVESVLEEFTGPIIFVSHDRYFINKVATKLLYLHSDYGEEFEGTYDDFKQQSQGISKQNIKTMKIKKKPVNYQKELEILEKEIYKLESKIELLEEQTFHEDIYTNFKKIGDLQEEIKVLRRTLKDHEEQYLKLLEEQMEEEVNNHAEQTN